MRLLALPAAGGAGGTGPGTGGKGPTEQALQGSGGTPCFPNAAARPDHDDEFAVCLNLNTLPGRWPGTSFCTSLQR